MPIIKTRLNTEAIVEVKDKQTNYVKLTVFSGDFFGQDVDADRSGLQRRRDVVGADPVLLVTPSANGRFYFYLIRLYPKINSLCTVNFNILHEPLKYAISQPMRIR